MSLPKEKFMQSLCRVTYQVGHAPVKKWDKFVNIESKALDQLEQTASMPFVKPWVAAMPDTHYGMGATVGSVIPTEGAVMPAAVGVDIGCGMMAVRTNLKVSDLGGVYGRQGSELFQLISGTIPHGRTNNGGANDIGAWPEDKIPPDIAAIWRREFQPHTTGFSSEFPSNNEYEKLNAFTRHPGAISKNAARHLGTLGTGNHFIEVCKEIREFPGDPGNLWIVIHSGSRGFGNRIGTYFMRLAGDLCKKWLISLPNRDLGYLPEGTQEFDDYLFALSLAQKFAWLNREIMMSRVLKAIDAKVETSEFASDESVPPTIHMHHNYADIRGKRILTRKGAVDASSGKFCIIPGSMGAKTYIAVGLGSKESFDSCSHGAGRAMSRTEALKTFTVEDHERATQGVVCDKTKGVLDETPGAYKDIDAVMESQSDLVRPVLKLKQLVCVKGLSD